MSEIVSDFSKVDKAIDVLSGIRDHRKAGMRSRAEVAWYEFYVKYLQRVREYWEKGEPIAAMFDTMPGEIIWAMDIIPFGLVVYGPGAVSVTSHIEQETLDAAREVGLALETCSGWRMGLGMMRRGWYPRPNVVVSCNATCDTCAKCYQLMADTYNVPGFSLDVPFPAGTERCVKYVAKEFEDMVRFLEENTGHKLDWDKLREGVARAKRMVELNVEIYELAKAKPSPLVPRITSQSYWFNWLYSGQIEGVEYLTILRDEIKEKVEKGQSGLPDKTKDGRSIEERFRLVSIPPVPQIRGKTYDWLWRTYGISLAASTFMYWPDFSQELDPAKPFESIARKYVMNPLIREYFNPCESEYGTVTETLKVVQDFEADGVVVWANPACDATSGYVKVLRDRLAEVGIPMVAFDHDPADETYCSEDELKLPFRSYYVESK